MRTRILPALLALTVVLAGAADAYAKAGGTRSNSGTLGSRGSRSLENTTPATPPGGGFLRPPSTPQVTTPPPSPSAAPRTGGPVESQPLVPLQPSVAPRPGMNAAAPAAGAAAMAAPAQAGFMQRNPFLAGMAGGLVGAGIGSMLFGHSSSLAAASELSPGASLLGLLLQLALIGGLVWVVFRLLRGGRGPAVNPYAVARGPVEPRFNGAAAPAPQFSGLAAEPRYGAGPVEPRFDAGPGYGREPSLGPVSAAGGLGLNAAPAAARVEREFQPTPADQEAFGQILLGIQQAWSIGDQAGLARFATPALASQLADDLARDAADGVANRVEQVRLLRGDVRESWREEGYEFVTAPLTFQCVDVMVRTRDGAVVAGDPRTPVVHSETWTFVRPSRGGPWRLSAIERG